MKTLPVESISGVCFESTSVFRPTETSRVLAQEATAELGRGKKVLDLGCGSGIVGLHLALAGGAGIYLNMSDLSHEATSLAAQNATTLELAANIKTGSLFDPWEQESFDLIVSDVSGVIPGIGDALGWFKGVPNASGPEGADLALKVIRESPGYLARDGVLVFPIISLSNEERLLHETSLFFTVVDKLTEVALPLGMPHRDALELKRLFPTIRVGNVGGISVFYTTVIKCQGGKEAT